jgi:predicted glycosyltransferase
VSEVRKRVWIDVECPPQVQYLIPFKSAFEAAGAEIMVTARDDGMTLDLLSDRGIVPAVVGSVSGGTTLKKAVRVVARAARLRSALRSFGRPDMLIATSRPAAIAARTAGAPNFAIFDYEHAELGSFRRLGTTILHPDVIPSHVFEQRGFAPRRLVPFPGLKEDISLHGIELETIAPHSFEAPPGAVKVLFRPPAETSHYFKEPSRDRSMRLLQSLASTSKFVVVFCPRSPSQIEDLRQLSWRHEPIVLRKPIPFVSLLKGVDVVVSSGGSMLREAACVGVPAFSIFGGEIGSVDRHLIAEGRLTVLDGNGDVDALSRFEAAQRRDPRPRDPNLVPKLTELMLERAAA